MQPQNIRQKRDEQRMHSLRSALSPIIEYLDRDNVIEIMLNADGLIWVEDSENGMYCTGKEMAPDAADRMIRLVASNIKREINESNPSIGGKLPVWGARVQASIPPIVTAPVFALRKPSHIRFTLTDYVNSGVMTAKEADFLTNAVYDRKNLLIGGGTGSGKTTLSNALLDIVGQTDDRLYIVEDTPELQSSAKNKLQILVTPPFYSYQRAIMDSLRYRIDRIIVGEVRDSSALDLLKSWNTGHPGGLATIHANDTRAMLDRLCQLIEEGPILNAPKILVAEAIDVCVHIQRDKKKKAGRSLSGIIEVNGLDAHGNWITQAI